MPRACVAVVDLVARRVDELLPSRRHAWRAGRRWRRAVRLGPRRLCSGTPLLVEVKSGGREQQELVRFRVTVRVRVRVRVRILSEDQGQGRARVRMSRKQQDLVGI